MLSRTLAPLSHSARPICVIHRGQRPCPPLIQVFVLRYFLAIAPDTPSMRQSNILPPPQKNEEKNHKSASGACIVRTGFPYPVVQTPPKRPPMTAVLSQDATSSIIVTLGAATATVDLSGAICIRHQLYLGERARYWLRSASAGRGRGRCVLV